MGYPASLPDAVEEETSDANRSRHLHLSAVVAPAAFCGIALLEQRGSSLDGCYGRCCCRRGRAATACRLEVPPCRYRRRASRPPQGVAPCLASNVPSDVSRHQLPPRCSQHSQCCVGHLHHQRIEAIELLHERNFRNQIEETEGEPTDWSN